MKRLVVIMLIMLFLLTGCNSKNEEAKDKTKDNTDVKEKVEEVLETIRPSLIADGGNVELVDVDDEGVVKLRLTGHCAGCPMSQMTLKNGIERVLKSAIPEVQQVLAVE